MYRVSSPLVAVMLAVSTFMAGEAAGSATAAHSGIHSGHSVDSRIQGLPCMEVVATGSGMRDENVSRRWGRSGPEVLSGNIVNAYSGSNVILRARVGEGGHAVSSVVLFYTVNGGPEQDEQADHSGGSIWTASFGTHQGGTEISWRVVAADEQGNVATWPVDGAWLGFTVISPGSAAGWGWNIYGQCSAPEPNDGIVAVSGGWFHSLGLKSDGALVVWGWNEEGEFDVPEPNEGFIEIASGEQHNLGLGIDGAITAWGYNNHGQLDVPEPNADFISVAAGCWHSLGLRSDGAIVAWGYNEYGQCDLPEPNSGFMAVAANGHHSLGLRSDGTIAAWGWNNRGQCNVPEPNSGFVALAAGEQHSLGLRSDGTIVAWGWNIYGQSVVPEPNEGYVAVAGGGLHSLGLKADGSIVAWGYDMIGQCSVPEPNSGFVAIAGGMYHSLGVRGGSVSSAPDNTPAPSAINPASIRSVVPNPSNPRTTVWVELARPVVLNLVIHDAGGRALRTLVSGSMEPGIHPVIWDGADDRGRMVPSGVYLVHLTTAGGARSTAKVTLTR